MTDLGLFYDGWMRLKARLAADECDYAVYMTKQTRDAIKSELGLAKVYCPPEWEMSLYGLPVFISETMQVGDIAFVRKRHP